MKTSHKSRVVLLAISLLVLSSALPYPTDAATHRAAGTTYYVSSSDGLDGNNGLSEGAPFQTIAKVNALNLQPGDRVLFKCGDTWRAEQLIVRRSGTVGNPITFGSYPAGCANRPTLSGAQPVSGWAASGTPNIYVSDLSAGANAGKFAFGVNQLFHGETRLLLGRWPNLAAGYATVDAQPSGAQLSDAQLPAGDWTGAVAHIRGMTWYILNRQVTGRAGQTLTLNASADCWGGCAHWGYFLNHHLLTLDQEGEWYYDTANHRLYLYTTGGAPANGAIEASVILKNDDRSWGGIMLGVDLNERGVAYVGIENLAVRRWFRHGIATPTNHAHSENHHVTLRDNAITDVDGIGINLGAWVWDADDGRPDGWRGGYELTVDGNTITRANAMGINTYSRNSTFSNNTIRDVGRVENLGAAGLGCSFTAGGGHCTEDGDGIRIKIDRPNDTGCYNTFTGNRLERIAYNGFDVFGHHNTFTHNVVQDVCITKADCGGVRTFGRDSLAQTAVYNLTFTQNMLINPIGNMDGCKPDTGVRAFGFYIDNYSKDVALSGNTVISATVHGILFQHSTGSVTGNTLYHNGRAWDYAAQVYVGDAPAYMGAHTDNILVSGQPTGRTFAIHALARLGTSNRNALFNPYRANHIYAGSDRTLSAWQSYSGQDASSTAAWYTQAAGEPPRARIFYNDTAEDKDFALGTALYRTLDQIVVKGSFTLPPYTSRVLIYDGENPVPDLSPSTKSAAPQVAPTGGVITYTLVIRNQGAPLTGTARLTDTLPAGLSYRPGTLHATLGTVDASAAPTLYWAGTLGATRVVTLTYAVTVDTSASQALINTAWLADGAGGVLARSATVFPNGQALYLPLVLKVR